MKTYLQRYFIITLVLSGLLSSAGCKSSTPAEGEKSGGGTASVITSKGPCANAFYPASATLKKTYKITFSGNTMPPSTYTESYTNVTNDGFMQRMEFDMKAKAGQSSGPLTVESAIKCKPEGLTAMEYGSLVTAQNAKFKFKTVKAEGVTFPNESEWKVGKKWDMSYEVEGEITGAPSPAMNMSPKGTIMMNSEIVGEESVTVPAGTFQTYKVVMTMNQKLNMNMMGRDVPMNNTFKTTAWFAKDVGMVKNQADIMDATTELISLTK